MSVMALAAAVVIWQRLGNAATAKMLQKDEDLENSAAAKMLKRDEEEKAALASGKRRQRRLSKEVGENEDISYQ